MIHFNFKPTSQISAAKNPFVISGTAFLASGIWQMHNPFIHSTLGWEITAANWGWAFTGLGGALITYTTIMSLIENIKSKAKHENTSPSETDANHAAASSNLAFQNSMITQNSILGAVPKEIWAQIFSELDTRSLFNCLRVSKTFHFVIGQDYLWKQQKSLVKNLQILDSTQSCFKKSLALSQKIDTCLEHNSQFLKEWGYHNLDDIFCVYKAKKMLFIGISFWSKYTYSEVYVSRIDVISLDKSKPYCTKFEIWQEAYSIYYSNNFLICQGERNWFIWKKKENAFSFDKLDCDSKNLLPAYTSCFFNKTLYFAHTPKRKIEALQFNENDSRLFLKPSIGSNEEHQIEMDNDKWVKLGKMLFIQDEKNATGRLFVTCDQSIFIYSLAFGVQFLKSTPVEIKHTKHIEGFFYDKGYLYCMTSDPKTIDATFYVWKEQKDRSWSLLFTFDKEMDAKSTWMFKLFSRNHQNLKLLF